MALPSTGAISAADVVSQWRKPAGTTVSFNQLDFYRLGEKTSAGTISFSDLRGKYFFWGRSLPASSVCAVNPNTGHLYYKVQNSAGYSYFGRTNIATGSSDLLKRSTDYKAVSTSDSDMYVTTDNYLVTGSQVSSSYFRCAVYDANLAYQSGSTTYYGQVMSSAIKPNTTLANTAITLAVASLAAPHVALFNGSSVLQWTIKSPIVGVWNSAIAQDTSGNIYHAYTTGGGYNHTYASARLMLNKLNSSGTKQWGKEISALNNKCDVSVDSSGNIYLCGDYFSSNYRGLVYKLDTNGNTIWSRHMYSSNGGVKCRNVVSDSQGNVYVLANAPRLVSGSWLNGYMVVKFNSSGTLQWKADISYSTSANDNGGSLTVDYDDNVFVIAECDAKGYPILKIPATSSPVGFSYPLTVDTFSFVANTDTTVTSTSETTITNNSETYTSASFSTSINTPTIIDSTLSTEVVEMV